MMPWVEKFWNNLTEEDKQSITHESEIIVKYIKSDSTRHIALDALRRLVDKYDVIHSDCVRLLEDIENVPENIIPMSDIDAVFSYFVPFAKENTSTIAWGEPEVAEQKQESVPEGSVFILTNDYYGELQGELIRETAASYYFKCFKNGEVVMESWRVSKNSPRIHKSIG